MRCSSVRSCGTGRRNDYSSALWGRGQLLPRRKTWWITMPRKLGDKDLSQRKRSVSVMGYKRKAGNHRLKQLTDTILFHDPKKPGFFKFKCWYCHRTFWTDNKGIRLCTDSCRTIHYNKSEYKGAQWLSGGGFATEQETPSNWLLDIVQGEEI